MVRGAVLALVLSACGGSRPAVDESVGPSADLAIAEIQIREGAQAILLHDDGTVELANGAKTSTLGRLRRDGVFTDAFGVVSTLHPDGTFSAANGPSQFTLRDETLMLGDRVVTFDDQGAIQGMGNEQVKLLGVTGQETQRSALLLIGMIMTMK